MTKTRSSRKIPIDYGIRDYYKYYKNNYNKNLESSLYTKIISDFNKELINLIIEEGIEYKMPILGLLLSIRKDKRKAKIVNGKLYNNTPVDWVRTRKLWDENEEAKEKKLLVRYLNHHSSGYVYKIFCKKAECKVKNKSIYRFKANRMFQRSLSARIFDDTKDKFDCFLMYNKKN